MTNWEAIFLGIIQGLTEFLPVSSSGHLELSQYLLGFQDLHRFVFFNLICHLGTLLAIFYVFAAQIKQAFTTQKKLIGQLILGTLPLFPLVLIIKPLKSIFDQPQYLGICFLITAALLFLSTSYRFKTRLNPTKRQWSDPLTIGVFQAVAVLPGISRSGATISAARFLGWQKEEAINFSFLLAIPAILGGTFLEIVQIFRATENEIIPITLFQFVAGFLASFFIGCLTLWFLKRLFIQDKWIYFAWYCLGLGTLTTLYFNLFY